MLEVRELVKTFGGLRAVDKVSFNLEENAVLGLIGINGSGKTTILNCISGVYTTTAGQILLNGEDLSGFSAYQIMHKGMGRTFQVPRVFNRMTLVDNLIVPLLSSKEDDSQLRRKAVSCLETVKLADLQHNYAEELSGGQQKLLELARLLMFRPKVTLLDEPFAGINPTLCNEILTHIENMRVEGMSFVLVSHDLTSIYRLSNHILVLNEGRIIAEGSANDVKSNPDVVEAYLGAKNA